MHLSNGTALSSWTDSKLYILITFLLEAINSHLLFKIHLELFEFIKTCSSGRVTVHTMNANAFYTLSVKYHFLAQHSLQSTTSKETIFGYREAMVLLVKNIYIKGIV